MTPLLLLAVFLPFSHPAPVPPLAPPVVISAPVHAYSVPRPRVAPTTTTTTIPSNEPSEGPQPIGPSTTQTYTACEVTWTDTETSPTTGQDSQVHGTYTGDCAQAQEVAAAHPGAVMGTTTYTFTYG